MRMKIKAMTGMRTWKRQSWWKPVFASTSHGLLLYCTLSSGCVFKELGYIMYTEATTQILAGMYIPPPGIEAFIANLILEISLIAKEIRAGSVSFTITVDAFIYVL